MRFVAPSPSNNRETEDLTVGTATNSDSAISALGSPRPTAGATSRSRSVSVAMRASATAPPMSRLVVVEARTAVDTRAGSWLLLATAPATVAIVGVQIAIATAVDLELSLADLMLGASTGLGILVRILGALAISTEWTQRTAPVTFALDRIACAWSPPGCWRSPASRSGTIVLGLVPAATGNAVLDALPATTAEWTLLPLWLGVRRVPTSQAEPDRVVRATVGAVGRRQAVGRDASVSVTPSA